MSSNLEPIPARFNVVSGKVVNAAFAVHSTLGPGLLESAYEACLCHELTKQGLSYRRQVAVPLFYDGIQMEVGYRMDILVEECVVIELKVCERWNPVYDAQMITYLKLSGHRVGLMINFHSALIKDGIRRFVL